MQALDISSTRASRNLNALYTAGFLNVKRDGPWVVYSLDKEELGSNYLKLIEIVNEGLDGNKIAKSDKERLKTAKRTGLVCSNSNENKLELLKK
jgi:DNA-binding transcriptional ArsR family regulator